MKSIRILLTDKCNEYCPNCLNRSFRTESKFISYQAFQMVAKFFHDNGVKKIRLMGGEPTLHPSFEEITKFAKNLYERVTVFTNGTNSQLLAFEPRAKDGINYNFKFVNQLSEDILMPTKPGNRVLSIVIDNNLNIDRTIKGLANVKKLLPTVKASLTFDCTANIFQNRDSFLKAFGKLYDYCIGNNIDVILDHALPICFLYGTNIPTPKRFSICDTDCSGLVDSDCNLHYCNINSADKLPLFYEGKLKPYKLLENFLYHEYCKNQIEVLNKICKDCPFYKDLCNGGCYVHNKIITRKDIINNTRLPLM